MAEFQASGPYPYLTRDEVRSIDQCAIAEFGMSGLVLMENAGRGAAEILHRLGPMGPVVILCGTGNNGGDGFVIARHCELMGIDASVWVLGKDPAAIRAESMSPDCEANYRIAVLGKLAIGHVVQTEDPALEEAIQSAAVLVDAVLGTGARGAVRSPFREWIERCNRASGMRIAIDIPTGLDCDTGIADAVCFRADHTITFVAPKIGFRQPTALPYLGQVHVVDIGVPKLCRGF
ncbi:MAG: NAD(P)H-hydrate epimerase [Pirellulales bacterium]